MASSWKKVVLALPVAALVGGLLSAREAQARGIIVYHTGEDVYETGDLPEKLEDEFPGGTAGYKCSVFGVFFADFARWDCAPVVYKETADGFDYNDEDWVVELLEDEFSEDDMQVPFWKNHGRWVIGAGVLGLVGLGVLRRKKS